MTHPWPKLALVAAGAAGLLTAAVLSTPPAPRGAQADEAAIPPEVVLPGAPLDAATLAEIQQRLGHKPFAGTVFDTPQSPAEWPRGASPSLLHAAHLLDEAAYVLERAEIFAEADSIRAQAGALRDQAKQARAAAPPEGGEDAAATVGNAGPSG
jgi:hypothetical protein